MAVYGPGSQTWCLEGLVCMSAHNLVEDKSLSKEAAFWGVWVRCQRGPAKNQQALFSKPYFLTHQTELIKQRESEKQQQRKPSEPGGIRDVTKPRQR
eukprot:1137585-Pelagomonas_calceolata.AAC.5